MSEKNHIQGVSMEEYTSALTREGVTVVPGIGQTIWRGGEMHSLEREPILCLDPPSAQEVRSVLWRARAPVVTYVQKPDDKHPHNAWLYTCQNYCVTHLPSASRRNIKKALKTFRFEFVEAETFLEKGIVPFCDTRTRIGLSTNTPKLFRQTFERTARNPAYQILGAWKGDILAAFMFLIVVDDWVAVIPYASTEYLPYRPNNGLMNFVMDYFLVQNKFKNVTYGLSSIQEIGKADSLHRFKMSVGFEAEPVHRTFVFHPLMRPFANYATLWALRLGVSLRPDNAKMRKVAGLLATYLGKQPLLAKP